MLSPSRLYCRNLTDKMPKKDLKRELYLLFSTYGSVLDIVTLKTMKMRGQAHIVFQDISKATQAMRNLDEKEFHGKKMVGTQLHLVIRISREQCR